MSWPGPVFCWYQGIEEPNQSTLFAWENQVELPLSLLIIFVGSFTGGPGCASAWQFSPVISCGEAGGMENQMGGMLHVCRLLLLSGQ